ncbi:MAG: DNA repair protein RadA [Deltaproteobacteria bacterium]|nr:DNA repair protein RadA [Deltaproteobacteria bacterium]
MAKQRTIFCCQQCGAQAPKWLGRCSECEAWNSYVEELAPEAVETIGIVSREGGAPVPLNEVPADTGAHRPIGLPELDRVLGGGTVPGSLTLLGGDPGIGKSTIILQALARIAGRDGPALYITGEESAAQVKMRADRLGIASDKLYLLTENQLPAVIGQIEALNPSVCAIDSIQTIYSSQITSAPGTVSQLREATAQLLALTKGTTMATFLIGHVTKDGMLAGPKVLEHMVDTVLYFEGERGHPFRLLRAVKNRFGSTNEIGVFEMTAQGLKEVANPSLLFLAERPEHAAGSVVVASLEGSRPVLVELQALVTSSGLANPRRTAIGVDSGRVALLVAVLEKVVGLTLHTQDIFLNVAGGLKINEPAVDLGVIAAIASSFHNRPIDPHTLIVGEVGLTGEVRAVMGVEGRLTEAAKMGFTRALVPKSHAKVKAPKGMELHGAPTVESALALLL